MSLLVITIGTAPTTNYTQITDEQLRELAEMTEYNNHSGALSLAADILDDGSERPSKLTIQLRTIEFVHDQQGYITLEQSQVRYALSQQLFEKAKIDFDPETFKKFYNCF